MLCFLQVRDVNSQVLCDMETQDFGVNFLYLLTFIWSGGGSVFLDVLKTTTVSFVLEVFRTRPLSEHYPSRC